MKIKPIIVIVLVMVLLLAAAVPALAASKIPKMFRFTMVNRSDELVQLSLRAEGIAYYLPAPAGEEVTYTVREGDYQHITLACGFGATGTISVHRQVKLVFPSCVKGAANYGEPGMEKITLTDDPITPNRYFQYQAE